MRRFLTAVSLTFFLASGNSSAQLGADNKPIVPPTIKVVDPYPQCGKAFHEKYVDKLNGKQRAYMNSIADVMYDKADLDGDGEFDVVDIQSRPAVEPCEMDHEWYEKKNMIHIHYDNDRDWQQEFIGDLVTSMNLYPGKQEVQVVMKNYDGRETKITFHYDIPKMR